MSMCYLPNQATTHRPNHVQNQGNQYPICPQPQQFYNLLPPGTVISVPKGPFDHYGILLYANDGLPYVISNSGKYGKVVLESLSDFAENQEVKIRWYTHEAEVQQVLRRALQLLGKPYSAFSSNCEHFIREISGLPIESPQLRGWGVLGGLALAVAGAIAATQEEPPKKNRPKKSQPKRTKKKSR